MKENPVSALKTIESIRVSRLKKLAETYYKNTSIPIYLRIRGDIKELEVDNIALFLKEKAELLKEKERLDIEAHDFGVKFYITRLPISFKKYSRWQNVGDYVGWVSRLMIESVENVIIAKESKLEKYRKNISNIRLLLVLNNIRNSGRAELPDSLGKIESEFNEVYIMLYPEKIYRVNHT